MRIQKTIEEILQSGKATKAARVLAHYLENKKLKRGDRLPLAVLAKRVERYDLGLKLLGPIIYGSLGKKGKPPSTEEICEYASLCAFAGLIQMSRRTFNLIPHDLPHSAKFTLALLEIGQWNHDKAMNYLDDYISGDITDHQKEVALANKLNCHLSLGLKKYISFSRELQKRWKDQNRPYFLSYLFYKNCEYYFEKKDFKALEKSLKSASSHGEIALYQKKFDLLLKNHSNLEKLNHVRIKQYFEKDYEFHREWDFCRAYLSHDSQLCHRLYYGSRSQNYRIRLKKMIPIDWKDQYSLGQGKYSFHRLHGKLAGIPLKKGMGIHRLLLGLTDDLYFPKNNYELFECLFPDQVYFPENSDSSIKQVILRARKFLKTNDLPFQIQSQNHRYRLMPGALSSIVYEDHKNLATTETFLQEHRYFKKGELESYLGKSSRATQYLIRDLIDSFKIKKFGKGPNTIYLSLKYSE